jgi:hypothetical protein
VRIQVGEVVKFVETFKAFPPRQKSLDFNMNEIMATVTNPKAGGKE